MSINPHLLGWLLLSMPGNHWPKSFLEHEIQEIWERYPWFPPDNLRSLMRYFYRNDENGKMFEQHFRALEQMGLIRPSEGGPKDSESWSPLDNWRLSNADELSWRYPDDEQGGDGGRNGGNDGGAGGNDGDGQDGDSGRGGIREVLGHPTLFALPKLEFENWVNNLF